jgi:hypothetical protein
MSETAEDLIKNYTIRCNVKGNYIFNFETTKNTIVQVNGLPLTGSKIPNTGQEITFNVIPTNINDGGKTMYSYKIVKANSDSDPDVNFNFGFTTSNNLDLNGDRRPGGDINGGG